MSALNNDYSTPNAPKEQTRRDNFAVIKESALLWSPRYKCLRRDVLELLGVNGPGLRHLLDEKALGDRLFIGVDRDAKAIQSCQELFHEVPNVTLVKKELVRLLKSGDPVLNNVGVLNFDTEQGPGKTLDQELHTVFMFANKQFKKLGAFLLILNSTRAYHNDKVANAEALANLLCQHTERPWTPEDVMLGHYRSAERKADMFNLHIRFGF